ncbi:MAG: peptidoglycan recognition family protein [Phycisphaerae bacterium]
MFRRVFIFFSCLFVLGGCASTDEPIPEIVYDSSSKSILIPPKVVSPKQSRGSAYRNVPRGWLPPSHLEKEWIAIVVHHSATEYGNAAIIDKWHRERNHWEGVGYDFVIGNGTDSSDGEVEVTFRWREQIPGAHCGGTPNNWANVDGIGICLVGDFNRTVPSERQMQSLLRLIHFLQNRYGISKSRIYGHKTTPGARVTDCPGTKFSMARLKSML